MVEKHDEELFNATSKEFEVVITYTEHILPKKKNKKKRKKTKNNSCYCYYLDHKDYINKNLLNINTILELCCRYAKPCVLP